ncbi:MAG: discoidin domain-containing protein, partial [Polyangiaceae bacterium]
DLPAQPTHRSWFVNATTCGLRLVVERTNAAPPVVREVEAIESAKNVLEGGLASDDGAYSGFRADFAIDGDYRTRWVGASGRSRWTLRIDLREPQTIDRVRLVLGFDSTSVPRPSGGRSYGMAWAPIHYVLEASGDGRHFEPIAYEPARADGTLLPLRRRLVTLLEPHRVVSLRLVMMGATGASGTAEPDAVPVIRELAAFRADDKRPILAAPWLLSVNANPSGQSRSTPGGEVANDTYHAKFLQARLSPLFPALLRDDRFARSLGPRGEWLGAPPSDSAGQVLESIEGDDPELDTHLLSESSPPPIVVLSGSNDWDYASDTGPDAEYPMHWHWDPLRDSNAGGMGQLAEAVQNRVAPFLGFCGGAQILALLESRRPGASSAFEDLSTIDRVLQRTSGRPIRGFAPTTDLDRAWPTDPHPTRAKILFQADDPLFSDLAGLYRRSTTRAMPEWHTDAIRPDAFLPGGPLDRFDLVATSAFCAPYVVHRGPPDNVFLDPAGASWCATVPEAFHSRDRAWPIIGAQFHAEQRDFSTPAPDDPPESVADARLFLAAAYEKMVDAYETFSP